MTIDTRQLRNALGAFATGVTIVTTQDASGKDAGMTVNSFSSVSLEPPMVLWSLAKNAHSRDAFLNAEYFGVHILASDQADLSTQFATRGIDKFAGQSVERGHGNVPLLSGCAARFECKTVFRYEGGDHDILVGEVVSFENFERESLVFRAGRYAIAFDKPAKLPEDESHDLEERGTVTSLQYLIGRALYQMQLGVRPEFARLGITELQFFILTCIAYNAPESVAELIRLVAISGQRITLSDVEKMVQRNLMVTEGEDPEHLQFHLTEAGQALLARIAAVNRAIEDDAMKEFGYMETQVFKQMLRKIIQRTLPSWRRPL
ncbi:MAG: flavin reductase [Rhodocyclaceae bacterium]|jgi:3-hydroxy-9,10-secoandrosta-1,3,5(10)-triene-9,17-dione monooxygenase reductase component|nr:flavin reductase [Rhodocyclaceae bacterium]